MLLLFVPQQTRVFGNCASLKRVASGKWRGCGVGGHCEDSAGDSLVAHSWFERSIASLWGSAPSTPASQPVLAVGPALGLALHRSYHI